MSDQFIGEIRMFGGNFAPMDWALCNGQQLSISQNDVLYSLIGVTYGGDGVSYFNLPDMRGRVPVHKGTGTNLTPRPIGQKGGEENVTITETTMPSHTHPFNASKNAANSIAPSNTKVLGQVTGANAPAIYTATNTSSVAMNSASVTNVSGGLYHTNLMPSLCVNFIIALNGIYPQQS